MENTTPNHSPSRKNKKRLPKPSPMENQPSSVNPLLSNIIGGIEVCEFSENFPVVYVSESFIDMTGYALEDIKTLLKGNHIQLVANKESLPMLLDSLRKQLDKNGSYTMEYGLRKKDGSVIRILDKGVLLPPQDGISYIQCMLIETGGKKTYGEDKKLHNSHYEMALSCIDVALFEYDIKANTVTVDEADNDFFGAPKVFSNGVEGIISSGAIAACSHDDIRKLYASIDQGCPSASAIIFTYDLSGNERIVEIKFQNIFGETNEPLRAIGFRRDITEKTLLQREKQYSLTLAKNRELTYEANISRNILLSFNSRLFCLSDFGTSRTFSQILDFLLTRNAPIGNAKVLQKSLSLENIERLYASGQQIFSFEYTQTPKNGQELWYQHFVNIIKDELTGDYIIRSYVSDITSQKEQESQALEERSFYEQMLSKAIVAYEFNLTKNLLLPGDEAGPAATRMNMPSNYDHALISICQKSIHPDDRESFCDSFSRNALISAYGRGTKELSNEYRRLIGSNSDYMWVRYTCHIFADPKSGDLRGFSYGVQIDEEKKMQLELMYRAQYDMLTGIYNKAVTQDKIDTFLDTPDAKLGTHVLFIIDIDHFKEINDTFGHAFGDAILSETASTLSNLFRDDDIVGRIGGDEFVAFMKNVKNLTVAKFKAQQICDKLLQTFSRNNLHFVMSVSVGTAVYGTDGLDYDALYRNSDIALYQSKSMGRNRYSIYDGSMKACRTMVNEINETTLLGSKKLDGNVLEYVLRILYETHNRCDAILSVLELVGRHFDMSRAYIFEDLADGLNALNTFEWCNTTTTPAEEKLREFCYGDFGNYKNNFNSDGIFYLPNADAAPDSVKEHLACRNISSLLQFSIEKNGEFIGFIGFDQCSHPIDVTNTALANYRNIANILGVFVTELRSFEKLEAANHTAFSIINGLDSGAYVCHPETLKLLFVNHKIRELAPNAQIGNYCYKTLWNIDEPCEFCPVRTLKLLSQPKFVSDIYNSNIGSWTRVSISWVDWIDGQKACLIDCLDISKYKKFVKLPEDEA